MPRGFAAGLATARKVYRSSRASETGGRHRLAMIGVGVAAYAIALLATLPARIVLGGEPGLTTTGTIWNGAAAYADGWRVEWRWSAGRSLAALGFAADVRIVGIGTELTGTMTAWPGWRRFENLSGTADAGLLANAGMRCEGEIDVARATVLLAGADSMVAGDARAAGLRCSTASAPSPSELPPMTIRAVALSGKSRIDIAPVGRARLTVIEGEVAAGRLHLAPTPAGATLVPALRGLVIDQAL